MHPKRDIKDASPASLQMDSEIKEGIPDIMEHTINDVLRVTTEDYLSTITPTNPPSPSRVEAELLTAIKNAFDLENAVRPKREQWQIPQRLGFVQIASIMAYLYPIYTICTSEEGTDTAYDLLAIYQVNGPDEGIYVTDDEAFRRIALQYNYSLTDREFRECMINLRSRVRRVTRTTDENLVAVNNGIYNYDAKKLYPFDPKYVFLSKSKVNFNPNATNVHIHNPNDGTDWDVESWLAEISDDPEITQLHWEILGAIIRPNVSWGKFACFYSESGNNGKGTLCELMRQLCGRGSYTSIPLSDMGKDFALEPLVRSNAIIVDENDVGTFIDKAANLKAIVTNDIIQINRKFKIAIPYRFYGFMVQCLNEMPRIKDKSDSFFRRQLFVPFNKSFTGHIRKYIKDEYLHRKDVLEYVMKKVLQDTNYYELSEPEACKIALAEYKEFNDPVRQFADEILPRAQWDLLPFPWLYELYLAWFKKYMPAGKPQNNNTFVNDLANIVKDSTEWSCNKSKKIRTGSRMSKTEPLLLEYGMTEWMNPHYRNKNDMDMVMKCTPVKGQYAVNYRGLERINATTDSDEE